MAPNKNDHPKSSLREALEGDDDRTKIDANRRPSVLSRQDLAIIQRAISQAGIDPNAEASDRNVVGVPEKISKGPPVLVIPEEAAAFDPAEFTREDDSERALHLSPEKAAIEFPGLVGKISLRERMAKFLRKLADAISRK